MTRPPPPTILNLAKTPTSRPLAQPKPAEKISFATFPTRSFPLPNNDKLTPPSQWYVFHFLDTAPDPDEHALSRNGERFPPRDCGIGEMMLNGETTTTMGTS
ncbi:hypothetical protein IMZ48_07555 [Candidatus Bathyarchaeota archaeon]|nr:hypothetical protein [Candidatus Bathyarchaeota archaeon]